MAFDDPARSHGRIEAGSSSVRREGTQTVICLSGEHDVSTAGALSENLLRAAGLDDGDLIVDLSGVVFMDVATVRVLVRTRVLLRTRMQMVSLRAPSNSARLVLDLCGVAYAPDREPYEVTASYAALRTWVAIPVSQRADEVADARSPEETAASQPLARLDETVTATGPGSGEA